jgi:acyl carrier protein
MDDTNFRLIRCFAAIFPELSQDQILAAGAATTEGWDSVASVTLFAMIEEEFGADIDIQDYVGLISFSKIAEYLAAREGSKATGNTTS